MSKKYFNAAFLMAASIVASSAIASEAVASSYKVQAAISVSATPKIFDERLAAISTSAGESSFLAGENTEIAKRGRLSMK